MELELELKLELEWELEWKLTWELELQPHKSRELQLNPPQNPRFVLKRRFVTEMVPNR